MLSLPACRWAKCNASQPVPVVRSRFCTNRSHAMTHRHDGKVWPVGSRRHQMVAALGDVSRLQLRPGSARLGWAGHTRETVSMVHLSFSPRGLFCWHNPVIGPRRQPILLRSSAPTSLDRQFRPPNGD
ncbi:unnamed protein product [Protopolystoma xenopodis]|uniref:Uncharacterized protein n=1 Tax=Protopolystoma xenopodis TaxID=117903 RepID=A0A3S5BFJ6_9PLAT|nr:unnamed protein product [Protopolystoma xenopodis]